MIRSFRCRETAKLFRRERSLKFRALESLALRKLLMLDASGLLSDLRNPPGNHLEKLSGNRSGQYSIRINAQWRICFEWRNNAAENVEIVDCH